MRHWFIVAIIMVLTPLNLLAQASDGQIRRPVRKQANKVTTSQANSTKPRTTTKTEHNASTYTQPSIQILSINDLATYNIVAGTYSILANAQRLCQKLRDEGWSAQIFSDAPNMFRVLMLGTSDEPEAILYRDYARKAYPDVWILKVDNNRIYKYE